MHGRWRHYSLYRFFFYLFLTVTFLVCNTATELTVWKVLPSVGFFIQLLVQSAENDLIRYKKVLKNIYLYLYCNNYHK